MAIKNIPIGDIVLDPRLQMRETMHFDAIDEYSEHLDDLPPCKVVSGEKATAEPLYWLTGGWHRYHAHSKAGSKTLPCEVTEGDFTCAILEAAGENHGHGIRRTNDGKRRAVTAVLGIEEYASKSDRIIADICHVSEHTVASVRKEMAEKPAPNKPRAQMRTTRTDRKGRQQPASKPRESNDRNAGIDRFAARNMTGPAALPQTSELHVKAQSLIHGVEKACEQLQQDCEGSDGVLRKGLERFAKILDLAGHDVAGILNPSLNDKPTPEQRKELFDAIVKVTASDSKINGGQIGKTVKALLGADDPYSAADVMKMPALIKKVWPKVACTVGVVEKYISWSRNGPPTSETELEKLRREHGV